MRHRVLSWPVALLAVIAIHVVSAFIVVDLHFNNSPDIYYTPGSPAVVLRNELRKAFPNDELLTALFHGADIYSPDSLRRIDTLAERLGQHALVDRVMAVTTMEQIRSSPEGFSISKLIDPRTLKSQEPEQLRARVATNRFAIGTVASRDGQYLAVVIRPKLLTESSERLALKLALAEGVKEAGLLPNYAGDAGPITMDIAQLQSILEDSARFVPATFLLAMALMWWIVGRWRPVLIGVVAMSTVILPTIAGMVLMGRPYTMASAILPSLLAAYTSGTLLHLYAAIQRGHAARLSRGRSLDHALNETTKPGLFNVVTTAAGLLSLMFVPVPPVQAFGAAGAFGTVIVYITVYFLVPPFLRHWDNRRWPLRQSGLGRFGRLAPKLAFFSMRHAKVVLISVVACTLALLPLAMRVKSESDLLAFFRADHPVRVQTRLIESKLSGVTPLEISIKGEGPDSLQSLRLLREMRALQNWLEKLPQVDRSFSMVDLIEEMHWAMNAEKPTFRALPPTQRLLRQYLLIYDGRDLFEVVDRDYAHARIVLNLNVHGSNEIGAVIREIRAHLADNPFTDVAVDVGGYGRLFVDQSDLLVEGQKGSFASAFLQIFVFMALLWRSVRVAAICMVPNLAPLYFVLVTMGLVGIHIDTATVMIASLVLGITVDDTIHIFHNFRARLRAGLSPVWAIARSFESIGTAVLAISLLLVSQFLLLAASDFIPTSNFGLMTAVGLLAGQVFELLLLPALLLWQGGQDRPSRRPSADAADSA